MNILSITWRNSWNSCFESPISVFDKICYANDISQNEFHKFFKGEINPNYSHPLINQLDYQKIQEAITDQQLLIHFQSTIYRLSHIFKSGIESPQMYFSKGLYQCSTCSLYGYHSLLFQSKFVDRCPFHNVPLTNHCKRCGSQLMYKYYKGNSITQCCQNCFEPILYHSEVYPNYAIYTEQQISTNNVLYLIFQLNEKEINRLQNIQLEGIKYVEKSNLDFLLYLVRELIGSVNNFV